MIVRTLRVLVLGIFISIPLYSMQKSGAPIPMSVIGQQLQPVHNGFRNFFPFSSESHILFPSHIVRALLFIPGTGRRIGTDHLFNFS